MQTARYLLLIIMAVSSGIVQSQQLEPYARLVCVGDYAEGPRIIKRNALMEVELYSLDGKVSYYSITNHYFGSVDAQLISPLGIGLDYYSNTEYRDNRFIGENFHINRHTMEINWTRWRDERSPQNLDFSGFCQLGPKPKF